MLVERDTAFHITLVEELAVTFPPQYPYAGNFSLTYHFFPDLFASIFTKWGNIASWDLIVRYLPTLNFSLLFLAAFILTRKLTNNRLSSLLAVFFLIFMGNMGFIFLLKGQPLDFRFEEYFTHHITMLNANPIQVALTIIILGFFCTANYLENGQRRWLLLAAGFLGLVSFYKIFSALQILVGLLVPAIILWIRKKDLKLVYLGIASGSIVGLSALFLWAKSPYMGKFIEFKPWYLVYHSITMRLTAIEQFNFAYEKFYRLMFKVSIGSFLFYFIWQGLFYFLGNMWLRVVGLKIFILDLLKITDRAEWSIIAYTILVGLIASFLFTRPPEHYNIIFSLDLSLYLMGIYAAVGIMRLIEKRSTLTKFVVLALFIAFSIPTTLNIMWDRAEKIRVSPQFVRLGQYTRKNLPRGSIIAHPFQAPLYILIPAIGGVRSMAEQVFPIENLLGPMTTIKLRKDNSSIYKTTDPGELARIITEHKLDYIIEDQQEWINCAKKGLMTEIYRSDGYVINKVIL